MGCETEDLTRGVAPPQKKVRKNLTQRSPPPKKSEKNSHVCFGGGNLENIISFWGVKILTFVVGGGETENRMCVSYRKCLDILRCADTYTCVGSDLQTHCLLSTACCYTGLLARARTGGGALDGERGGSKGLCFKAGVLLHFSRARFQWRFLQCSLGF